MDYNAFKTRCKEKGYSPSSLVAALGLSTSNITNWKNGGNPSYEILVKISQELECSVGYLIGTETESQNFGAAVSRAIRKMKTTPLRTISLVGSVTISDEDITVLAKFLNTSILYLCSPEPKDYQPVDAERKSLEQFDIPRYMDILIELFDNVIADKFFSMLQIQISKIVLYNLGITSADGIEDDFLKNKISFILTNQKSGDNLANTGFNLSDLIRIGRMNGKSLMFMFTGVN